jgi:hypothetical protein
MEPHIAITHGWYDDDIVELTFEVCDGTSQVINSAYVVLDWLQDQAAALATFSRHVYGGIYDLKAGEIGPEYANGAFRARFHYHKPNALLISTFQQSDYFDFKNTQTATEAKLFLRTEPGLLDEFVDALKALHRERNGVGILRCIPLAGA